MRRWIIYAVSAACGLLWAAVAIGMALTVDRRAIDSSLSQLVWGFRGGILASPLIGIAVTVCCVPLFRAFGPIGRAVVALTALYFAAFAFMFAVGVLPWWMGDRWAATQSIGNIASNSWNAAVAGLTWTGFVLVLGPAAYLNFRLISLLLPEHCRS